MQGFCMHRCELGQDLEVGVTIKKRGASPTTTQLWSYSVTRTTLMMNLAS